MRLVERAEQLNGDRNLANDNRALALFERADGDESRLAFYAIGGQCERFRNPTAAVGERQAQCAEFATWRRKRGFHKTRALASREIFSLPCGGVETAGPVLIRTHCRPSHRLAADARSRPFCLFC